MTRSTSYPSDSSMLESRTLHFKMTVCRRSGNVKRRVPGTSSSSHTDTITNWTEIRLRQMNTWKKKGKEEVRSSRSTVCLFIHPSIWLMQMDRHDAAITHLRGWANEAWPHGSRSVFHTIENPGDSVGFGEKGGVADSKWCAQAKAAQGTDGRRRFGQKEESHGVGHEDS